MHITKKTPLLLIILMTAFPQLSETIYSPALTDIAKVYQVTAAEAQLTMSVYFIAFAAGIIFWGRMSDSWGRRPALFSALLCYGCGAFAALNSADFTMLIIARLILAFGASAGSVVIQTMLRDSYQGSELSSVFATIGTVLAFSPAIGPALGAGLVHQFGLNGVFLALCALAIGLFATMPWVTETHPGKSQNNPRIMEIGIQMIRDSHVRASILSIAGFNIILFGYYTLAPFTFEHLALAEWVFGLSGLIIAAGGFSGALISRRYVKSMGGRRLIRYSIMLSMAGSLLQFFAVRQLHPELIAGIILAGQFLISASFGCAIPNLLSGALQQYRHAQGTAGALLGLSYYTLIAAGLGLISYLYRPVAEFQPLTMFSLSVMLWFSSKKISTNSHDDRPSPDLAIIANKIANKSLINR